MKLIVGALLSAASLAVVPAHAEGPVEILNSYQAQARTDQSGFVASAERGRALFTRQGNGDWSCATCHTQNPSMAGKHASTGKSIDPLAPAANPARFSRADKVEKWFKRNCGDVLGRPCTASEKSDLMAYLISVKP